MCFCGVDDVMLLVLWICQHGGVCVCSTDEIVMRVLVVLVMCMLVVMLVV